MRNFLFVTALSIVISLTSCKNGSNTTEEKVLFIDNFDHKEDVPNPDIWELCKYYHAAWAQYFKDVEGYENVRVEKGNLVLKGSKDGDKYKNGGIRSKIGFPGNTRLEVKARLDKKVRGAFPAIWQMPMNGEKWPLSGEIDLMEWIQSTPDMIYQTLHTQYIKDKTGHTGATNPNPNKQFDITEYHIYAAERTEKAVIFYVDGKETWRYNKDEVDNTKMQFPFCDYQFDIILNYSLGGLLNGEETWAGIIHDEDLPGEMWIDWVRVVEVK